MKARDMKKKKKRFEFKQMLVEHNTNIARRKLLSFDEVNHVLKFMLLLMALNLLLFEQMPLTQMGKQRQIGQARKGEWGI